MVNKQWVQLMYNLQQLNSEFMYSTVIQGSSDDSWFTVKIRTKWNFNLTI